MCTRHGHLGIGILHLGHGNCGCMPMANHDYNHVCMCKCHGTRTWRRERPAAPLALLDHMRVANRSNEKRRASVAHHPLPAQVPVMHAACMHACMHACNACMLSCMHVCCQHEHHQRNPIQSIQSKPPQPGPNQLTPAQPSPIQSNPIPSISTHLHDDAMQALVRLGRVMSGDTSSYRQPQTAWRFAI